MERIRGMMRGRHGSGGRDEGTTAGAGRDVAWAEVMMAVAKGSDTALRVAKAEEKKEGCSRTTEDGTTVIEEIVPQREGREAITFGMRVGEVQGIIHGAQWKQYASSSGKGNRYEAGGARGWRMPYEVWSEMYDTTRGDG